MIEIHRLTAWMQQVPDKYFPVFLVGGSVRDYLLGRPLSDLDLAGGDAAGLAEHLSKAGDAALVRFDKKPGEVCYRVVERGNPENYLDIVDLHRSDITADLGRRDFTINAMALPVHPGGRLGKLVDPHKGRDDLERGLVRMVALQAFANDPLRILRAWRFAAELGYRIDPSTRRHAAACAPELGNVAAERIVHELFRILAVPDAVKFFREMASMEVLDILFPEKAGQTGTAAPGADWETGLSALSGCELILQSPDAYFSGFASRVRENIAAGNRLPLLKLAALLVDAGNSRTGADARTAEGISLRLKLSRRDRSFFQQLIPGLKDALTFASGENDHSRVVGFFRSWADAAVPIIVLALAVVGSDVSQVFAGIDRRRGTERLCRALIDYYSGIEARLAEPALISGTDLVAIGIDQGPGLGAVLEKVRRAQDEGRVASREEALSLARLLAAESK